MITHRPCGKCEALVPADAGCQHWPGIHGKKQQKSSAYLERKRIRDRQRVAEKRARERAKRDVAAFREMMTTQGGNDVAQAVEQDQTVQHQQ